MKIFSLFQQTLFQRGSRTRVNRKKKPGFLSILSDKALCISFAVSIIFHAGLIYIIPAAILFSEGLEGATSEMIEVDFIQENKLEIQSAPLQVVDNQFRASTPTEPDMTTSEIPPQPLDKSDTATVLDQDNIELISAPLKDRDLKTETDYMLLANSPEPEIELFRKRSVAEQNTPIHQKLPDQQQNEKLMVKPEHPQLTEIKPIVPVQSRAEVSEKLSIAPIHVENSHNTDKPEENVLFPLRIPRQIERQPSLTENIPEKRIGLGTPLVKEIDRQTTFSPSSFIASEVSKKRQFGFPKENKDAENRFGIFAGKELETPQMKETVQKAAVEKNTEIPLPEDLEKAKRLKASSQIEGPVKGRKIVYQPPLPQVDVEIEVEFKLRFWVLPDGTIGEVIPIKRGDARLERVAIAYLKKWQFEPLSPEVPQNKIWGTIPIRFTVQ
jgi:TonB family protein